MRYVLSIQGFFYLLTGLWPLVHIGSFQMITGPKTDLWLVKTVGLLVAVIGVVLLTAVKRHNYSIEIFQLGLLSALSLTAIDIFYVIRSVIPPVYLWDAGAECVLVALLIYWRNRKFGHSREKPLPLP
jgi:hypothetical protein